MHRLVRRPSPGMVVACVALLVALGGTSVAAVSQLARNSVGTPQLRNNAVSTPKIRNNAITTAKVRNRSLRAIDFARGQLPQGPPGPQGAQGTAGPAGPAGPAGAAGATNVVVRTASTSINANAVGAVIAQCNAGERATGGGALLSGHFNAAPATILRSYPTIGNSESAPSAGATPTSWTTRLLNPTGATATATGFVVCAAP